MFATPTFPSYFYPMGFVSTGNLWQVPSLPDPSVSTVWQLPSPQDPSLYQIWQMPSPQNRSVSQNWQMPSLQNRSVSQNYLMPRPQDPPSYRYPNPPNYSFLNYPPPEIKVFFRFWNLKRFLFTYCQKNDILTLKCVKV